MAKSKEFTSLPQLPARPNFYEVQLASGESLIAEWRARDKKVGKVWWKYTSPDPTIEKKPEPLDGVVAWRSAQRDDVEALLRRELTDAEQADALYQDRLQRGGFGRNLPPPPAHRRVQVGEVVDLVHSVESTVAGVYEDGRVLVMKQRRHVCRAVLSAVPQFLFVCVYWTDVRRRGLSEADKVEDAYQMAKLLDKTVQTRVATVPPAHRQFKLGDAVQVGDHLVDGVVAGVREAGQLVIIKRPRNETCDADETVDSYYCKHWTDVLPRSTAVDAPKAVKASCWRGLTECHSAPLLYLLEALKGREYGTLTKSPDFDRGEVWSAENKERYLDTLFSQRDLGRFLFVRKSDKMNVILDGHQRLQCLWDFMTDQLAYKGVYWHQLAREDRQHLQLRLVQVAHLDADFSRAELLRIYLEVNDTGVPVSHERLQRVRDQLAEEEATAVAVTEPAGV